MKITVKFLIPLLVLAVGGAIMFGILNKRPITLSIEVRPHSGAPAALRAIANDVAVVDSSLRGRSSTGGFNYQSTFGADLNLHLMWFNVLEEQFYETTFDVDAHTLSTFGDRAEHASINILVGPGADVEVTTPHPEGLRLVGLNRMDEITPEMDVPVILLTLCADKLDSDPSAEGILMRVMSDESSVARAMEKRMSWLENNEAQQSRCAEKENK